LLLIIIFSITPSLIYFGIFHKPAPSPAHTSQTAIVPSIGVPIRLIIPTINVDAEIVSLGVSNKGEMEVPDNTADVGWFRLGSIPGEIGSAVIAGHFDGKFGEPAVFTNLNKLKTGDKLYVKNESGISTTFTVSNIRTYDPGFADEVYSANDTAHLNLITCDGTWNNNKKSYTKRLVVFTDATP
jgi:LPXTG-site transpeptidase (sortase) family protein